MPFRSRESIWLQLSQRNENPSEILQNCYHQGEVYAQY